MGVGQACATDPLDSVEYRMFGVRGPSQTGPVGPLSPSDDIVDGCERVALVIEMTVPHVLLRPRTCRPEDRCPRAGTQSRDVAESAVSTKRTSDTRRSRDAFVGMTTDPM